MKTEQTEPPPGAAAGGDDLPESHSSPPSSAEHSALNVEQPALSPEEMAELKAQAAKAKESYEHLLRTTADFENYRKRAARERQDAVKFANESLLQKLIPALDNFDMAIAAAAVNSPERRAGSAELNPRSAILEGVNMILSQLRNTLTEAGLEEIDATGKPFDPNFHEAVSQQETKDVPEGQVVQQIRKGYRLRERLLRPATVIVAKKPSGMPVADCPMPNAH